MSLHPFIESLANRLRALPPLSSGTPAAARERLAAGRSSLGQGPVLWKVDDIQIPTRSGGLTARFYKPGSSVDGLIVYFHGGGWMLGALDDFDTLARTLAHRTNCAVLMPAYRLAPEYPFPAAYEDSLDSVTWAAKSITSLAGDNVPLVLTGDSTGGNLVAATAQSLRGKADIAFQVLIYPVTDIDFNSGSYTEHADSTILSRRDMIWFFDNYAPGEERFRPEVSPLRAEDLSDLPSAYVLSSEYDVLRDEAEAYAAKMRLAGVDVTTKRFDGMSHGFLRMHKLFDVADVALNDISEAIRSAVAKRE